MVLPMMGQIRCGLVLVENLSDHLEHLAHVIGLVEETPGPDLDHDTCGGIQGKTALVMKATKGRSAVSRKDGWPASSPP
jgi:hypothetical protein